MLKLSSLSVDPAYWLGKILPYIPTPQKSSRRGKIIFSSILALIFLFLCVPLKSVKNPYAEEMLAFSPAEQAREIKNRDRKNSQAALDYIKFYQGLPDVKPDAALEEVKAEVEAGRGWVDNLKDKTTSTAKDLVGENAYAFLHPLAKSLLPAGLDPDFLIELYDDSQKVYEHWRTYKNGENVNAANLAMDGTGFILGIVTLVPGPTSTAAKPARKALGPVRKTWANIPGQVKDEIFELFKPIFVVITESNLMEFNRSDLSGLDSFYNFYKSKTGQLQEVATRTESALEHLGPILALSAKNEPAAELVLLNSPTPKELEINLELANRFTNEDMPILQFGGGEALRAAARLQKRGEFDTQVLKAAMRYGPAGLAAVGNMPGDDIIKGNFSPRRAYSWLQILLLVLYIPYACLALIKTWRPAFAYPASAKAA